MKTYNNYCGNKNITLYYYNEWSDPEIEFCGFRWSAPIIEGELYNMMVEENIPDTDENLSKYISEHVKAYLIDCLYTMDLSIEYIHKNAPDWFEYLRDSLAYESPVGWRVVPDQEVLEHYGGVSFVINDFCIPEDI